TEWLVSTLRTNARQRRAPVPLPCTGPALFAAQQRAAGSADIPVRDRCRRGLLSRPCKRRKLLFLSRWPARLGMVAGQHRFAAALAFAAYARGSRPQRAAMLYSLTASGHSL